VVRIPTLAQLKAEPEWRAEITPPTLVQLGNRLADYFGFPRTNIGIRGNAAHLRGYHRSRRWIKNSVWCTSRTYSVSRTAGDRSGGDSDACSALDVTFATTAQLIAACRRLDRAVRAGKLEKITEWYGNKGGDSRVDGYDNVANQVASSDESHLWHLHMSFDRGRVLEDHSDVYEILTGDDVNLTDRVPWFSQGQRDRMVAAGYPATGLTVATLLTYTFEGARGRALDDDELAAVEAAAQAGATAGVLASVDTFVAAVVEKLPTGSLTRDDVESAVRAVFADAGS
jgi:hypothetical protein